MKIKKRKKKVILKQTVKLFGVAGSGKTTACLSMIKDFLEQGYTMEDICFTTFTTAGIRSIKEKLRQNGVDFVEKDCNFRTLNSLTWRLCNFSPDQMTTTKEIKEFFKSIGLTTESEIEGEVTQQEHVIEMYNGLLNSTGKFIDELNADERIDYVNNYLNNKELDTSDRNLFLSALHQFNKWKDENKKKLHIDSIIDVVKNKIDIPNKVLIVDEAQDLSYAQTLLVELWTKHYDRDIFVISGDDDQTIYQWSGAKPEYFINYTNNNTKEVILNHSYRLPRNVAAFCNCILRVIDVRKEKWITSDKEDGLIKEDMYVSREDFADWFLKNFKDKNCFLLFRTQRQLGLMAYALFSHPLSVPFSYVKGEGAFWSSRLICISNALNKLQKGQDLLVIEARQLLDTLPSKICLVQGAKSKYDEVNDKNVVSYGEFISLTKLWNVQKTLSSNFNESVDLKVEILRYMKYSKGKLDDVRQVKREEDVKCKLKDVGVIFELRFDNDGKLFTDLNIKLGTFHSSKGLEKENVFVFLGTNKYFENVDNSEKRVFYVACSRSLRNLFFVRPFDGEKGSLDDFFSGLRLKFKF